jgi:GNAT superfamily N-acetyltransferase
MPPLIRKAIAADAQIVHDIMCSIPWINDASKSQDGYKKTTQSCERGEIFLLTVDKAVAAMMMFRKDHMAASCGYNIWNIPLVVTIEAERRKGYARKLVRKAKQVASRAAICAHAENKWSLALLKSEGFVRVRGQTDSSGHPLYEWTAARQRQLKASRRRA